MAFRFWTSVLYISLTFSNFNIFNNFFLHAMSVCCFRAYSQFKLNKRKLSFLSMQRTKVTISMHCWQLTCCTPDQLQVTVIYVHVHVHELVNVHETVALITLLNAFLNSSSDTRELRSTSASRSVLSSRWPACSSSSRRRLLASITSHAAPRDLMYSIAVTWSCSWCACVCICLWFLLGNL